MTHSSINTAYASTQLVKIIQADFNGESINSVDARELHDFLDVGRDFSNWIKGRIDQYGFVENIDYVVVANMGEGQPANKIDYALSIDMAKELSMVERNDNGRQARKYFIQCEKALKTGMVPLASMPTAAIELKACVEMAQIFGLKGNQALLSANTAVKNLHGIDCMKTLGITGLISENSKQYFTPSVLGKKIGLSAVKFNKALEEAGMQVANRDHKKRLIWQVTEAGKQYCQLLDTNKKHSDGTPIHQVMWCDDVLDVLSGRVAA